MLFRSPGPPRFPLPAPRPREPGNCPRESAPPGLALRPLVGGTVLPACLSAGAGAPTRAQKRRLQKYLWHSSGLLRRPNGLGHYKLNRNLLGCLTRAVYDLERETGIHHTNAIKAVIGAAAAATAKVTSVVSDSVRPHRWQPTRLPRPWDCPSKNTGVGCHFLLQCMKSKSESEVAQSCPTLSDPMDCNLPGSSVHGIFQARVLEWVAIAFSNTP